MAENSLRFSTFVNKDPSEVIDFVADVNNRTKYQSALTAVSDIEGDSGVGQSWRWRWEMAGQEFEGTGKGVQYDPGKLYEFVTEGSIASRFTYRAESEADGTQLTVEVGFDLPAELAQQADLPSLMKIAKQKGDESLAQLKQTIER